MAVHNELLVGRFNRFVQKFFSMKGRASLRTLSDELFPVLPFFNGVENRYLESWNRFGQTAQVAAVAAQNSATRLRNPVGSNLLVVVEKLLINQFTVADTPQVKLNGVTTDLASLFTLTNARMDPRGNPTPSAILSLGNNVASIGGTKASCNIGTLSNFEFIITDDQEMPILPGDGMDVVSTAVNVSFFVTIFWRERFLEESERF